MAPTRIIHRGYSIEISQVRSAYSVAIEPVRPELSILGRRVGDGFASEDQAAEYAKRRIDTILKD